MISLHRPSEQELLKFTRSQSNEDLTYREIGETRGPMPENYFHNEHSVELGLGRDCFAAAHENLRYGRCLQLDWVSLLSDGLPLVGQNTAIVARVMRVWTLNCCRVVDVQMPSGPDDGLCFSIALGTLPRHIMVGEERFTVSMDSKTGTVRFSIRSFSRASHFASVIGTPLIRHYQRCFVDDVANAMQRDLKP